MFTAVSETPVYILLPRSGDKRNKVPSRVDFQEPKSRADFLRCVVAFYSVARDTMSLLHRFKANFSEALYAGFGVGSSVSLVHLKPASSPY
ncbi:hypothetical protein CRUP_017186 [Coryphaenoides rupestris]|nr:hypothetical protein CRUP_007286 [Coryphaenoides rupestris]KAG7264484.1 hypothetical protein CRUP_017186 [Coryphaenoides rupestris]